jgi:WD40 repeat protein
MLLAVGDDGRLRAWDADRDEFLWAIPAHTGTIWSVSSSRDGRFAVTAGSDNTLRIWSLRPPAARSLDSSRGSKSYLFSARARILFQTTAVSEWGDGERDWTFRLDGVDGTHTAPGASEPAAAVSADQRLIAHARADGTIVLRDRISGSERSLVALPDPPPRFGWPRGGTIRMMRFLDNERLATAYSDGTLGIVPLSGGVPAFRDRMSDEAHAGLEVISQTRIAVATKSRLHIYDLERDDWLPAEYRAPSRIESLAVTSDGAHAAVGLSTGGIKVIALHEAREEINLFGHAATVVAVAYSPDGKTIASACGEGIVRIWHAATGQELFVVEDRRGRAITSLSFTADGRLLVAGSAFPDGRTITTHDPGKPPN